MLNIFKSVNKCGLLLHTLSKLSWVRWNPYLIKFFNIYMILLWLFTMPHVYMGHAGPLGLGPQNIFKYLFINSETLFLRFWKDRQKNLNVKNTENWFFRYANNGKIWIMDTWNRNFTTSLTQTSDFTRKISFCNERYINLQMKKNI